MRLTSMPAQSDAVVRLKPYSDIQSAQGNVLLRYRLCREKEIDSFCSLFRRQLEGHSWCENGRHMVVEAVCLGVLGLDDA